MLGRGNLATGNGIDGVIMRKVIVLFLGLLATFPDRSSAEESRPDNLWSLLGANCMANAFLKRNATNTGWTCSDVAGEKLVISGTEISSAGFVTPGPVSFSSHVVIQGDVEIRSAKIKAIYVPYGGIHVSTETQVGATAPGQMFSKKVVTSTLTVQNSMIEFVENGVVISSMTGGKWVVPNLESTSISSGKIQNSNRGDGAPTAGDCTLATMGLQYVQILANSWKIHFCVDNGAGGAIWKSANLN